MVQNIRSVNKRMEDLIINSVIIGYELSFDRFQKQHLVVGKVDIFKFVVSLVLMDLVYKFIVIVILVLPFFVHDDQNLGSFEVLDQGCDSK